jgi:hypothetical protein
MRLMLHLRTMKNCRLELVNAGLHTAYDEPGSSREETIVAKIKADRTQERLPI